MAKTMPAHACQFLKGTSSSRDRVYEHADPPHPLGLLRARCQRPSDRAAAEHTEELASPHVQLQRSDRASYRRRLPL